MHEHFPWKLSMYTIIVVDNSTCFKHDFKKEPAYLQSIWSLCQMEALSMPQFSLGLAVVCLRGEMKPKRTSLGLCELQSPRSRVHWEHLPSGETLQLWADVLTGQSRWMASSHVLCPSGPGWAHRGPELRNVACILSGAARPWAAHVARILICSALRQPERARSPL